MVTSLPKVKRVIIDADFSGYVHEGNTGDEEFGVGMVLRREINMFSGQIRVDFAKRREIAMVNA